MAETLAAADRARRRHPRHRNVGVRRTAAPRAPRILEASARHPLVDRRAGQGGIRGAASRRIVEARHDGRRRREGRHHGNAGREGLRQGTKHAHVRRDRVIFTGLLDAPEICQWLQASDVYTLVSRVEGLPVSLIEAMAVDTLVAKDRLKFIELINESWV